jgi:hypothetical protein
MKLFQSVLAILLLVTSTCVFAAKPDPVENPPLQIREQNLDPSNDAIRVSQQGIVEVDIQEGEELDVNVTNPTLDVSGSVVDTSGSTVSVDNIPQPPYAVDAFIPPAGAAELPDMTGLEAGDTRSVDFPTINATTIAVWDSSVTGDGDPEFQLWIRSPLTGGGGLFKYAYDESLYSLDVRSFTHPVPVSGVEVWCKNESQNCTLGIAIIGY